MKRCGWLLSMMLVLATGCGASRPAEKSAAATRPADAAQATPREVNLLTMGDIGQVGPGQARVAAAMEKYVRGAGRSFDALFTAGDNFYVKFTGVDDPKWRTMFEDMYNPSVLNFPFYAALGNHDYEEVTPGGVRKWQIEMDYAKAHPNSRWKLPAHCYRVDFPGGAEKPLVSVLVLDSYKDQVGEQRWAEQLAWVKEQLDGPRKSRWIIAVAHHPLFSNGRHGDIGVMQRDFGPLFQKYGVDLYICGHDHDLQHLEMPGYNMSFLLVGGGGASTRPMQNDVRGPFSRATQGFADLSFTAARVVVRYIGVDGSVVHAFERTHGGKVKVLETTPSDRAVPLTVKEITRPDAATRRASTTTATTKRARDSDD